MRSSRLVPLYSLVALTVVGVAYHLAGALRRLLDARVITRARIRQLNAIASNLSRILIATETESALLNRDVSRFLGVMRRSSRLRNATR